MTILLATTSILLAQASLDGPIDRFLEFLAKVMMLIGVVMIFYGGWKIHRGEVSDGLLAIVGGFIAVFAIPIVRYIVGLF